MIGIPFSDPTAEGEAVQDANIRALEAGMTTDGVFDIVAGIREQSKIPLAFRTYANPVFQYGYDRFFLRCEELGVGAVMIQEIPFEEKEEVEAPASAHRVSLVSTIAPASEERICRIAAESGGFLQAAGAASEIPSIIECARRVTQTPCVINLESIPTGQLDRVLKSCDGVIADRGIVELTAAHGREAAPYLTDYVKYLKRIVDKP